MLLRLTIGSLLLVTAATAQQKPQEPEKQAAPTKQEAGPAKQEPAPAKPEPTPAEQAEQLAKEKDRLQQEIEFTRQRATVAKELLRKRLERSTPNYRAIDAGTSSLSAPAPVASRRSLRVMSEDERKAQPASMMLLVDDQPIGRSQYDDLMNYLGSLPNALEPTLRSQRAMFELIRTAAVAAAFKENEAASQAQDLYTAIEGGKSVADIAAAVGSLPGAQDGGRVEITRNSIHGSLIELAAFTTPAGKFSRPFQTTAGYVIVGVDSIEKGATPDLDKALTHIVLVKYVAEEGALQRAQMNANAGQVSIIVRDEQTAELLPALFRNVPAAQPQPGQVMPIALPEEQLASFQTRLKEIEKQLAEQRAAATPNKDLIERLSAEQQKLQNVLQRASGAAKPKVPELPAKQPTDDLPPAPKADKPAKGK